MSPERRRQQLLPQANCSAGQHPPAARKTAARHAQQRSSPPFQTAEAQAQRQQSSIAGPTTLPQHPPPARWRDSLTRGLANLSPFAASFFQQQQQQQRPTTPRAPAARLWNPQNFSPRSLAVPNVPVEHPDIATRGKRPKTAEQGRDEYPLLTLPEQRRSRQSLQAPSSLQVERSSGNYSDKGSVKLPDNRRSGQQREQRAAQPQRREESPVIAESSRAAQERARARAILESAMPANEENGHAAPSPMPPAFLSQDPMRDVEAGRSLQRLKHSTSRASLPATPRTPTVLPTADTTAGAEQNRPDTAADDGGDEIAWGPQHPCFPHMNPHVPLNSQEYAETRIIRVRRDWMQVGDLAPTFQNLYPEVLGAHVSEDEFRRVVQHINGQLVAAFSPWSLRAWMDTMMGIATFWLWDDLGLPGVKGQLRKLEAWIESWNRAHTQDGVKIIPLRRTAYMAIDFEIPDPHITLEPSLGPSRPGTDERPAQGDYGPYPINVPSPHGDRQQNMPQGVALEAR